VCFPPAFSALVTEFEETHPGVCVQTLSADKAYDNGSKVRELYEEHGLRVT